MASLAVAAIGAGIGSFFQNAALGWAIGSFVGSTLFGPGGQDSQGPRLQDLKVQSSAYGKDIPIVYGSARMAGNVIWATPLRETATEEDQGKGGGGSTVTTYTYDATFAVLLCEGPITGIRKIWAYGELIYNLSDDASLETIIASNRAASGFTIYTGSETQTADPLIQADLGAANTQAYRGYAYVVFNRLQLEKYGNRIPELTFEVIANGTETGVRQLSQGTYTLPNLFNNFTGPIQKVSGGLVEFQFANLSSYEDENGLEYFRNSRAYTVTLSGNLIRNVDYEVDVNPPDPLAPNVLEVSYNNVPKYFVQSAANNAAEFCGLLGGRKIWVAGATDTNITNGNVFLAAGTPQNADSTTAFYASQDLTQLLIDAGETGTIHAVAPNSDFNLLILFCGVSGLGGDIRRWYKLEDVSGTIQITSSGTMGPFGVTSASGNRRVGRSYTSLSQGCFANADGSKVWSVYTSLGQSVLDLYTLSGSVFSVQTVPDTITGTDPSLFVQDDICYVVTRSSITTFTDQPALASSGETLSSIQSDICQRAGLSAGDINVAALTDTVTGYVIPRNMSGRAASEQLMKAFFYDPADIGNKITFVKRGGTSTATITADDLGAHYYGSGFETISHERLQDPELPSEIVVKHIDINRAYQDGAQRSQRITHPVENISTTELSIVMTATKAKQIAEIWMQNAFTERDKYQLALSRDFIDLNPTDVITVPTGGGNRDLRITKITYAPVIDIEAVADSPYTSNAAAGEGEAIGGAIGLQGPTNLLALDIPLLRNADNDEGIYLAANGYFDAWAGAQVFSSNSEDDGYTPKTSIFNDAVIGSATTALASASFYDWDRTNTVTVSLVNGDLSSVTEDQVAQGSNYCLLGNEIIQYANATLNANGTYTLDTLTRGRRGTDWATGTHAVNERFVFIGALTLKRIDQAYNTLKYYKAATFGSFLDEAESQSVTNTGVSLKPFSPTNVAGSRDGSNNLTITWKRRSRYIAPTFRDLPLFEESESYEVDVMSGSTVLRTISVTAQTASYTAAQQTADGLTPGNPVTVRVYQLSAIVGRGYQREATI